MTGSRLRTASIADIILVAVSLAAAGLLIPFLSSGMPQTVAVYRDNRVIAEYPLGQEREFTVAGATGDMTVAVKRGGVHVKNSHCPRNICVHSIPIMRPSRQIVCAPNHIVIEIRSHRAEEVPDAIAE